LALHHKKNRELENSKAEQSEDISINFFGIAQRITSKLRYQRNEKSAHAKAKM
jgi:hypothetical protein